MSDEVNAESTVSYTVKELLDEQTGLLRGIDKKVDAKADKSDLVRIEGKIDSHAARIDLLEEHRDEVNLSSAFRRRVWAVIGSVSGLAAIITAALIGKGHW